MASFEPIDYDPLGPRPSTPVVRREFLLILAVLCLLATAVYGVPLVVERAGYAWEAGRARAASDALAKLDKGGVIDRTSVLFHLASTAVAPAVVNIRTRNEVRLPAGVGLAAGLGSGVVVDKDNGYIVTNNHVIKDANAIVVQLGRGRDLPGRLIGADALTDLAVIQVRGPLDVAAPWGDSDKVDIGDWVLAIGSPYALNQTVTAGIVSATGRSNLRIVGEGSYEDFIQTDAAINPGNSGGPLINLKGEVIGINTAIYSPPEHGGGNTGIGFAISSAMARRVVDQLIKNRRVVRGYLGVAIDELDPVRAEAQKVPDSQGAVVVDVQPDSPAARAGLKPGDVIVSLAERPVVGPSSLRNRTANLAVGSRVPLTFYRGGHPVQVEVMIAEMPALIALGLRVRDLPPEQADALPGAPDAAVIIDQVVPGSPAHRAGLAPGLRVLAVAGQPVQTRAECEAAAERAVADRGIPFQLQLPDGNDVVIVVGGPRSGPRR